MKRLYIFRHAKSSWAVPGMGDFDRSLNKRGREQTLVMSDWFAKQEIQPQRVLCSPAARTLQTLEGVRQGLGQAETTTVASLYNGTIDDYLSALWPCEEDAVMIVGHNPTCDELTRRLAAHSSPAIDALLSRHFSTSTVAVLDYSGAEWTDLRNGSCQLVDYVRPKDLQI